MIKYHHIPYNQMFASLLTRNILKFCQESSTPAINPLHEYMHQKERK